MHVSTLICMEGGGEGGEVAPRHAHARGVQGMRCVNILVIYFLERGAKTSHFYKV